MTEQERAAIENSIPRKPIKHELGGGYYYKCHWLNCNTDLYKWFKYCPGCGNRIDWSEIDDFLE